jgi:CelD/BcsL family acetyltransferase involved in cellulose biosynthesis
MSDSLPGRDLWTAQQLPLPFRIGEVSVGKAHLRARVCNLHFSLCPDASLIAPPFLPANEDPTAIAVVRSCPTARRLPRIATVQGRLRYAERHYLRYTIDLSGTYEQYLAHFSSKTRNTLMRKLRRFKKATRDRIDWQEYTTVADVDEFFSAAFAVAKRTYQYRMFDDVFSDDHDARQDAYQLAEKGQFRGSVLRLAGRPIAFLYSPISEGHLLYRNLGYDPNFEALSPGTVLLLQVLESSFRHKPAAKFDFFEGENDYKALFATSSVYCADLYFFPPTLRNKLLVYSHTAVHGLSRALVRVASAVGIKKFLKRGVRRWWSALAMRGRAPAYKNSSSGPLRGPEE